MSVVDDFLKKMKMVSEDEDYDEYDDEFEDEDDGEDDEEIISKKPEKRSFFKRKPAPVVEDDDDDYELDDEYDEPSTYTAPKRSVFSAPKSNVVGMNNSAPKSSKGGTAEVVMIMPKSFEDANTIADVLLSKKAVVLNLEGIDMAAAQRIIDFASGSCYTIGGSLQKISKKIFIVVPKDMSLSGDFDGLIGDAIDLDSVNIMR